MNDDLTYIKGFSSIKISRVCRALDVDRSNLLNGRLSDKQVKKVRRYLESELAKLYIIEEDNNVATKNSLEHRSNRQTRCNL